jgi:gamma-glutamylcyclotransferase (GGCT)/AIG2-like uncharacterized protein YtfP
MQKNIFTYGSLMFPRVWERVVTGTYSACPATLHGYRRLAVKGEEYPAAIPCPDACIAGRLYLGVNAADLAQLDDFEGEYYAKTSVEVTLDSGGVADAEVYILKQAYSQIADAFEWDVERFRSRGIEAFITQYQGFRKIPPPANM